MRSNVQYRDMARNRLHRTGWTQPVLATLIYVVLSSLGESSSITDKLDISYLAISAFSGLASLAFSVLFAIPMSYTYDRLFLRYVRGHRDDMVSGLFSYFKEGFGRALVVPLLTWIFVALWTLLLIVPGIIKGLAYSMSCFVANDHPELDAYDCIKHSEELMKGHKGQLFCLYLSFIGWALLCVLTFGIGFLWLSPYMEAASAEFYQDLLREHGEMEEVPLADENDIPLSE